MTLYRLIATASKKHLTQTQRKFVDSLRYIAPDKITKRQFKRLETIAK